MIYTWENLAKSIEENGKALDEEKIKRAYDVAAAAHQGQCRVSGEPYISHPVAVAMILVELGMDTDTVIAALLHDVVEDTPVTSETVKKEFSEEIALLVDGVTKLGKIPYSSREEQQAENVRKMLLAMAQDVRVIIIKLADRLHNMRTLDCMPAQKQRDKALETMEVYAPLAHRLGIRAIKEELEDLSLRYLDSIAYNEIENMLELKKEEREQFLNNIQEKISQRLAGEFPHVHIEGRVKSIYGIYRKVYIQGKSIDEIYDVYAVRIIVDSVLECYNILGIIHDMFRPIPNRFKDYISTPKPNMYQSLHTTVIGKEAIPFEIQIRTWDMHHTAEYGIAAHWKYKVGISGKDKLEERLAWVRQLLEAQKDSEDVEDIVRSIKSDLSPEEVYVFTPKGDVFSLPSGSTVIDFAYAIHTEVGNRMIGAKVDGRIVPLDSKVKTGMIIEILTSNAKGNGPSRDWLNIVKTTEARNKIRTWFKRECREENIATGKSELEREMRRNLITFKDGEQDSLLLEIAKRHQLNSVEDFYAAIGYGGIALSKVMPKLKELFQKTYRMTDKDLLKKQVPKTKKSKGASSGVIVEGIDSCLVKFARCCNPLPGDDIIGFITRGYGVSIHKKDCINVALAQQNLEEADRWINAHWAEKVKETFKSTIDIYCTDRAGLIADISIALNNMHVPIHALIAKELKDRHTGIQITMGISGLDQLNSIITNIKKIPGIVQINRAVQ